MIDEAKHTPGPWVYFKRDFHGEIHAIVSGRDRRIANCGNPFGSAHDGHDQANARRIVACVNWCQGVTTEFLETASKEGALTNSIKEMQARNDKLSAALDGIASRANHALARGMLLKGALENIRDDAYEAMQS